MLRKRRPTNSGASQNPDPTRSKRQRIGDSVKILLDIAKESSDWLPPLKSALGGVNALIKHYEQFEDVREKIGDLIPQLERFKQIATTTVVDGDQAEEKRRSELSSALEEIKKRSEELLRKGAAARFVDKDGDSGEVAKLVERLREAITHYQISQQQAVCDQITNLTSSFNALLKLHEKFPAVKDKLDSVMARLNRLHPEEDGDDGFFGESEPERRARLFDTLRPIMDNGRVLHNRIVAQGYEECQDDVLAASEMGEDIRDALLDYQMAQQRMIYDQGCRLIDDADLAVLNSCRRAPGAGYQHGDRRGCLRGMRETVLNEIELWIKDPEKTPVFWLNGLAGTGKSTIAQTVSERVFADGLLGASFFCSRDFEDRSDLHFVFPTLAFQLAHKYPEFRSVLAPLLRSNPDIVHESLYSQMEKLIVEPLRSAGVSTVIVIDALDECTDDKPQSAILSVVGRLVGKIPKVKFFITGRPEPRIKSGFRLPLLEAVSKIFILHDVQPTSINDDIKLFLKHELSELAQQHKLDGWPADEDVNLLCQRAAGLFVYAAATVKYLDNKFYLPNKQFKKIVDFPDSTRYEGRGSVDSLYLRILGEAFCVDDPDICRSARSIIGTVILVVNPLPPSGIAELVGLETGEVLPFLKAIQSLLILDEDTTQPVKPFHKSFPDFLTDPSRCSDTRFYISLGDLHLELATNCLRVMNDGLEQNLLSLPNYALNSEVKDLQTRIDNRISMVLRYACQSWHNHLIESKGDLANVVSNLCLFLEEKFLAWLEVLSVLKALRGAAVALQQLMLWLQKIARNEQLLDTTKDYLYFVTKFFEPINLSATHIYHSALELSPQSSIVRKLYYHQRPVPFPRVLAGNLGSWDSSVATSINGDVDESYVTWSPCGQFVAVQIGEVVEVQDPLTLELLSTLQSTPSLMGTPAYSPDGCSLACACTTGIIIWDIQTGGIAQEIQYNNDIYDCLLVWSLDGGMIGIVGYEYQHNNYIVCRYDVTSGTELSSIMIKSWNEPCIWAHDTSFYTMTTMQDREDKVYTVGIFEVGFTLTKIKSFRIRLRERGIIKSFSPATYHISIEVKHPNNQLLILDLQNLRVLLDEKMPASHCLSPDGSLLAAIFLEGIHIWKHDSGCYTPWRQLSSPSPFFNFYSQDFQLSPTLSSILGFFPNALCLWSLDDASNTLTTHSQQFSTISHNQTYIVTANCGKSTVTITNLSGIPFQFIDTDVEITALVLIKNVLLVVGAEVVVAWLLAEDGEVNGISCDRRADNSDSLWSVSIPPDDLDTLRFSVRDETVSIESHKTIYHIYDMETGEAVDDDQDHKYNDWYYLEYIKEERHFSANDSSSKHGWTRENEWIVACDSSKHGLWLPIELREAREESNLPYRIAVLLPGCVVKI